MEEIANYVPQMYATFWALIPPVVAIVLALITKEVYSSLFLGIVIGGLFWSNFRFEATVNHVFKDGIVRVLTNSYNMGILVFLVILGVMVCMMNKAGGSAAFGRWASAHIKTRIGAQLASVALGVLIFIDDYFNCLTVGSVMRPVTDKHQVSRAKLSYIIDATAAPVCIIAPISSWAAAVAGFVEGEDGFSIFIRAIPYNYYALFTIIFMIVLIVRKIDYGPMRTHEKNALKGDIYTTPDRPYANAENEVVETKGKVIDLVFPMIVLITACVIGMIYSGGFFSGVGFVEAFSGSDASVGLMYGSFFALVITIIYYMFRRVLKFSESMSCIPEGFKAMVPAILILTFAWTLKAMTDSLGAKEFVAELVKSTPDALLSFLPALVFIIACFLAFATGTSWGTFGMLIPIVVNAFEGTNATMMIISISACMAGAVCGDHCSPISDTTIMASAGAQCNHINHVSTQLPYAITVALVSFVTYIIAGFFGNSKGLPGVMKSPVIPLVIGLILLYVVLQVIKTVEKRKIQLMQNKRLEMKKTKGSIMLLFAAFFWGTTFVAQTTASDQIGTFTFNGSRSIVGAAFLALLILARTGMKKQKAKVSGEPVEKESIKRTVIGGILCGCVLFFATNLQQSGIAAYPEGVASSGRSGFLTATYVVMVAIVSGLLGKKLHKIVYVAVFVCLGGMYMLCMSGGIDNLYFGDLLGLLCAVCFTGHILAVDHFNDCDSVKISCIQFITNGVLSLICMAIFEQPAWSDLAAAWFPILYAGIFSSGIAYTLQIAGQKYADPAVASIVMSLESVFAVLGGFVVLHEVLAPREIVGCVLVFTAVILAQVPQMRK